MLLKDAESLLFIPKVLKRKVIYFRRVDYWQFKSFFFLLIPFFCCGVFCKQKLKWTLTILALAASVSLITAVEVINKSAINQMARSANLLNGYADINLVSINGEFEEELFNKLVSVKNQLGITAASQF